jgi:hypothetical protein
LRCALVASLAVFSGFAKDPMHGADRTQVHAALEQCVIDLNGWLIAKLSAGEDIVYTSAFLRRQRTRLWR